MTYQSSFNNIAVTNVSRRDLLKGVVATGGLILAAQFPMTRSVFAYATGAAAMPHGVVTDPHVFVSIDSSGLVTILAARGRPAPPRPQRMSARQIKNHRCSHGQARIHDR